MSRGARQRRAFTLLEVMAAVLVLGLLYTVLADAAMRGLRSEGVSRRRVEASLIADRFLADLEAGLALGVIPKTGQEEQDVDVYRVGVSVQPFDPTPMLDAIEAVEKERGLDKKKPRSRDEKPSSIEVGAEGQGAAQGVDLLAAPRTGEDGRLRRIDIAVTWQDGDREEQVLRTTFAFDTTGLENVFPKKGGAATGEGDEGDDGTGSAAGKSGKASKASKSGKSGKSGGSGQSSSGKSPSEQQQQIQQQLQQQLRTR